ncbi:MAG: pimeloyl-ACP methyl ester carboxylesterase [Verrucomicrobiales bacterium]|jgi:pimeloyl-ACP methyl ester carboxylesterase
MSWDLEFDGTAENAQQLLGESGIQIAAPGFEGGASQESGQTPNRSFGPSGVLDSTLQKAGIHESESFRYDLARDAETAGSDKVRLRIRKPDEGYLQCLLAEDEAGGLSWHIPIPKAASRGVAGGQFNEYDIPCRVEPIQDGTKTRSILGYVNRHLMKILVFPITDRVFGPLGEFFIEKWEAAKRPYRIRTFTPENYVEPDAPAFTAEDWRKLGEGRALLFVHGTFSRAHSGFGGTPRSVMDQLHREYEGRVFAFDHFTLSEDPVQNVDWFLRAIPDSVTFELDIVSHSRGGLVARVLAEKLNVRRVLFCGVPNRGTVLAEPGYLVDFLNRYSSLTKYLPTNPASELLEAVIMIVKAVAHGTMKRLAGVSSMRAGDEFLTRLNSDANALTNTEFYAIAANFEPDRESKELGAFVKSVAIDQTVDSVFGEQENDLVVPYRGVYEHNGSPNFPIPEERILRFGKDDGVHHGSFFPQGLTGEHLTAWLKATDRAPTPTVEPIEGYLALVIGIDNYRREQLKNPVNDARAVTQQLLGLGYAVTQLEDCDRDDFSRAVLRFASQLETAKTCLLFYAGHGMQLAGENYLIPANAMLENDLEASAEAIGLSWILKQFELHGSGNNNVVILDCCRNNPYRTRSARSGGDGLGKVDSGDFSNTLIAFSTAANATASDGKGDHSPYTSALLQHLEVSASKMSVGDFFIEVAAEMTRKHEGQRPWLSSNIVRRFPLAPQGRIDPLPFVEPLEIQPEPEPEMKREGILGTRFPENYARRLIESLSGEVTIYYYEFKLRLPSARVAEWVRQGLLRRPMGSWERGQPMFQVNFIALAAAGEGEALRQLLGGIDHDRYPLSALLELGVERDPVSAAETARIWLERRLEKRGSLEIGDGELDAIWLLAHGGDHARAMMYLAGLTDGEMDPTRIAELAERWAALPGGYGLERARQLLESVSEVDESSCVPLAAAWVDLFDDQDRARGLLDPFAARSVNTFNLGIFASGYTSILDNLEGARRCLSRAKVRAESIDQRCFLASRWCGLFDADAFETGRRLLRLAEESAQSAVEWEQCGRDALDVFADLPAAKASASKAEQVVKSAIGCTTLYFLWLDAGEPSRAADLISRAPEKTNGVADLCHLARWHANTDHGEMLKVANLATSMAEETSDWLAVADFWRQTGDSAQADAAVANARDSAVFTADWLAIAEDSESLYGREPAIAEAFKAAVTENDQQLLAEFQAHES